MSGAHAKSAGIDQGGSVKETITHVETYILNLPYKNPIHFAYHSEDSGPYILLRIRTSGGAEGIAECVSRPAFNGEDPGTLAHAIKTYFAPILKGRNALDHNRILRDMAEVRGCRSSQSLIDVALWDLRGKILGLPVYRLLGGGPAKPVPVSWLAHGNTVASMIDQAVTMVKDRGFRGLKLKTWKRSTQDLEMVKEVRHAVGDDLVIYCDANSHYTETEAKRILARLGDYNIAFIEDPCDFKTPDRMALMAAALPVAILGDQDCQSPAAVQHLLKINAVGGVSVKLSRTGITDSLKIIAMCEAAGLPNVIGTDSESRLGTLARMHLRTAIPSLDPWPTETHFYEKLSDDVFKGHFNFDKGLIEVPGTPGFGAAINEKKLQKYLVSKG